MGNSQKKVNIKQSISLWSMDQGDIIWGIIKYFDIYEKESTTHLNLRDIVKAVLRGKFIDVKAYSSKEKRSQIFDLFSLMT